MNLDVKKKMLDRINKLIVDDFGVIPWLATEIEFYILGFDEVDQISNEVMLSLSNELKESGIDYIKIEKERGKSQFEVAIKHSPDVLKIADSTADLRLIIEKAADEICLAAVFEPKPLLEDFGSGLHIHVSLHDTAGSNLFKREENTNYSELLTYSAGGMLKTMRDFMMIFAPYENSYARFCPKMNVPVTVSWGTNNRTTALRLPSSHDVTRHIEHRVAGSDADFYLSMAAVLAGVHFGLKNKLSPPEQIYGDASLAMYSLEMLPTSLEESERLFKNSEIAREYFPELF